MAGNSTSTRARIVEAAERLFAQQGIEGVSLREINRRAGAKNAVAVQYHFEDRAGVLRAILEKHRPDVEARRRALLDQYEAVGSRDIRLLATALVLPLAAKLGDPEGGREFLQIYADLLNRPDPMIPEDDLENPTSSVYRWRILLEPLLEEDAARLHRRFTATLYTMVELARRARSGPRSDDRLFTSYLIDVVAAILAAPVSEETRRLARDRDTNLASRGRRRGSAAATRRPPRPASTEA